MSSTFVQPQPSDPAGTPETGVTTAPLSYIGPSAATTRLATRWGRTPNYPLTEGMMLAASQTADLLAPFQGTKVDMLQEREFPRTYKFGYPNVIGAPIPVLGISVRGGINLLNYDGRIPEQVIDYVVLEAYRMTALPQDRGVLREAVGGASVTYGPDSVLDQTMFILIQPFLGFQVSEEAWPSGKWF